MYLRISCLLQLSPEATPSTGSSSQLEESPLLIIENEILKENSFTDFTAIAKLGVCGCVQCVCIHVCWERVCVCICVHMCAFACAVHDFMFMCACKNACVYKSNHSL